MSVGYLAGYVGEGEIGYAGTNALARARLAGEIVRERIAGRFPELRIDVIGSTSLHGHTFGHDDAPVRRSAARGGPRALARRGRDHRRRGRGALHEWPRGWRRRAQVRHRADRHRVHACRSRACRRAPSRSANGAQMPKLYELAHCRAGDKGNTSTLSVIAYRAEDFPLLARHVTAARGRSAPARHRPRRDPPLRASAASRACNSSARMRSPAESRPRLRSMRTGNRFPPRCSRWRSRPRGRRPTSGAWKAELAGKHGCRDFLHPLAF